MISLIESCERARAGGRGGARDDGFGEMGNGQNKKPGGSKERRARHSMMTKRVGRLIKHGQAK